MDLGAEFVHGEKSILKTLIDQNVFHLSIQLFTFRDGLVVFFSLGLKVMVKLQTIL
jgi:hypothetical protein